MDGIELGKPRFVNRKRREVAPKRLEDFMDMALGSFPVADEPVGNQFFDVRTPQADAQGVAVFDFIESILVDLSGLFDPFLQGGDDPQRERRSLLSQVLKKADVFMVSMEVGLGPEKFGEFIYQQDHSRKIQIPHGLPDFRESSLAGLGPFKGFMELRGEFPKNLLQEDVFQEFRGPVLDEGNFRHEKSAGAEIFPEIFQCRGLIPEDLPGLGMAQEKAEHAEEMRLARAEMAFQKYSPPFRLGERSQDSLQAVLHFPGDYKGVEDHLPQMGILKVFELNDCFDLRDFD